MSNRAWEIQIMKLASPQTRESMSPGTGRYAHSEKNNTSGAAACTPCPAGQYSSPGKRDIPQCSPDTYSDLGILQTYIALLGSHFLVDISGCFHLLTMNFCNESGGDVCFPCQSGYYSESGKQSKIHFSKTYFLYKV